MKILNGIPIPSGDSYRFFWIDREGKAGMALGQEIHRWAVDWSDGQVLEEEILTFGGRFANLSFAQPVDEGWLVKGKLNNGQFFLGILDGEGKVIRSLNLGWLDLGQILVDRQNRIIVGYYDQAAVESNSQLIVWSIGGEVLYRYADGSFTDALYLDEEENIALYHFDEILWVSGALDRVEHIPLHLKQNWPERIWVADDRVITFSHREGVLRQYLRQGNELTVDEKDPFACSMMLKGVAFRGNCAVLYDGETLWLAKMA